MLIGANMKSFAAFLSELMVNDTKKKDQFHPGELGKRPDDLSTHIGTLPNGHKVYHRASKHGGYTAHHYSVHGDKSNKSNIVLKTYQTHGHKAEAIGTLQASGASKGVHHLYQHLVVKHNKILTGDNQSAGARKVWDRAGKHPKVNIHGYSGRKPIHAKSTEDEHYSDDSEWMKHFRDSKQARKEGARTETKSRKDLDDLEKVRDIKLVMHKK